MANTNISSTCFFIGLGTGIALTVLFAPRSGRATRQWIRRRALDGTDVVKRQATELRDRAKEMVGWGAEAPVEQH